MNHRRNFLLHIFLLSALLLSACQGGEAELPMPDLNTVAPLLDTSFSAELTALSGESRELDLTLTRDVEDRLVFSLDYLYVGRTTAPTNRTGRWHFDGTTLTLDVVEQDGEPVVQPALIFAVADDQLIGTIFDQSWFDVDAMLLASVPFQDFLD